ncbi:MAG: DNA-processing protein DprA, partial [Candidatus Saccharimonadales bacterium]
MKINRVTPSKHNYLRILSTIPNAPTELFFRGTLPSDRVPTVAIVGTRRPTSYGKEVCHTLAHDLAKRGIVVVSGLALGIDAIAHRAALEAGGTTIAVLASSVDQITPHTNRGIGEAILDHGGAIMSEYDPPNSGRDFQFLERNRIVSGLSDAIIIVEAA